MDSTLVIALASVGATATVGLAAVLGPVFTRRGDRNHQLELRIRDQRAKAYELSMRLMPVVQELDRDRAYEMGQEAAPQIWLWGSPEVRALFTAWGNDLENAVMPDATEAQKKANRKLAEAVRQRMGDEVQGRVPLNSKRRWRRLRTRESRPHPGG